MKRLFSVVFLGVLVATIGFGTVYDSSNLFAFDIYRTLSKQPGNIFLSPFSISTALAMAYIGAADNTAQQMKDVLHFNLDDETLHSGFSELISSLNQPNEKYQLSIANSMWAQEGYPFLKEFIDKVQKYYSSGLNYVDFAETTEEARQRINNWVEEKTNQRIKDIIKPGDIDSLTKLVLTNAIYFKGNWAKPFDPSLTKKETFYVSNKQEKQVEMMFESLTAAYTEDSLVQVLELPYAGDELSMIIVLPLKGKSLEDVEGKLSLVLFKEWVNNLRTEKVDVYLPKFKMECRLNLKKTLVAMGMIDAFTDEADFSKMDGTTMLKIKDVIHQSFVDVNEEGTEATASTAVIINIKMGPSIPVIFKADKPFLFFIYDKTHDLILFMGRLSNP
ncbi:MAG TPA: serpin family protein [Pseudothermotoga sp.]|nr:serpin family protein [Pseudothermotoga sp.]HOK84537.1 serpin family protein [Pseudothermotoga sp.]HPP69418.1 serpin family protein [Pseudothermotoga sp.]